MWYKLTFFVVIERIIVTSEYYTKCLKNIAKPLVPEKIAQIAKQTLLGLSYLNNKGIVHRALSPNSILFDTEDNVRLFNYGLYYMSEYNKCVSFPIGNPKYMSPDIFLSLDGDPSGPKVDVWSLGIILAELVLCKNFWSDLKPCQVIKRILSLINCSGTVFEHLANEHRCSNEYRNLPLNIKNFINLCLTVDTKNRPTPKELLKNEFLPTTAETKIDEFIDGGYHVDFLKRIPRKDTKNNGFHRTKSSDTTISSKALINDLQKVSIVELSKRKLKEIYYLWQLAGGDVYSELKKQGMIKNKPPVLSLPKLVLQYLFLYLKA